MRSTDCMLEQSCIDAVARLPFWPPKSKKSKKDKKGKDKVEEEEAQAVGDDDLQPIDVLTDVIIGFLEASTAYMRTIANQAFGYLSSLVKASTVDLLIAVRFLTVEYLNNN